MELNTKDLKKIPNVLSLTRMLLILPFFYFIKTQQNEWFLSLAIIAMITDWLDGYIARKFNQVSDMGKILDPLADKINTAAVLIALHLYQGLPAWIVFVIVGRDILIITGAIFIFRKKRYISTSNVPGKLAMLFIALSVILYVIAGNTLFMYSLLIALIFILLSFTTYMKLFFTHYLGMKTNGKHR